MKKIAILTWLHNYNYGSVLQAYALNSFLRNNGFLATNIDYRLTTSGKIINFVKEGNSLNLFFEKILLLKNRKREKSVFLKKKEKFDAFIGEISTTAEFNSSKELELIQDDYDAFICGSDQIWSPRLFNPTYYLDFVSRTKKISYACSFGSINTSRKKNKKIIRLLSDFSLVTVRENEGKSFLKSLGIHSDVVMDPVFLLPKNNWESIIHLQPDCVDDYCFAYFLSPNNDFLSVIDDYCLKNSLFLVCSLDFDYNFKCKNVIKKDLGPKEWLSYLYYSACVVTDSFHGLAFSIIFKKQVVSFERFKNGATNNQNSRIYELTNKLNFSECIFSKEKGELVFRQINDDSEEKMSLFVNQSKAILIGSLVNKDE